MTIYEYTDHCEFLRDFINSKKKAGSFSAAKLAEKAGLGVSLLKMVLIGKRKLDDHQILRLATALNFGFNEKTYFEALVKENQAESAEVKRYYRMRRQTALKSAASTERSLSGPLALDAWYIPSLLLYLLDIEEISQKTMGGINREKIKALFRISDSTLDRQLAALQKAGVLSLKKDGKVQIKLDHVGNKLKRQEFVLKIMEQARLRAQSDFGKPHAYFSADTLTVSAQNLHCFIEDYKNLVSHYIAKDLNSVDDTKVAQMSFQLFTVN